MTKAYVAFTVTAGRPRMGFRFLDCVASYRRDDDSDPEDGYGRPSNGGFQEPSYSTVSGYIGASVGVDIYPAQFGIPGEPYERVQFWATPGDLLSACVQHLREERQAPEYVI